MFNVFFFQVMEPSSVSGNDLAGPSSKSDLINTTTSHQHNNLKALFSKMSEATNHNNNINNNNNSSSSNGKSELASKGRQEVGRKYF